MTAARDELRRLVEQLPEEQVPAALAEVQRLASAADTSAWPPPWFGAVTSARGHLDPVDELLAEGFQPITVIVCDTGPLVARRDQERRPPRLC